MSTESFFTFIAWATMLSLAGAYFTWQGRRELRKRKEREAASHPKYIYSGGHAPGRRLARK